MTDMLLLPRNNNVLVRRCMNDGTLHHYVVLVGPEVKDLKIGEEIIVAGAWQHPSCSNISGGNLEILNERDILAVVCRQPADPYEDIHEFDR